MADQASVLVEAMREFASQFGDDSQYSRLVMEILLEEIMSSKLNSNAVKESGNGSSSL